MPKFTEDKLNQMCKNISDTEDEKMRHAFEMLKDALSRNPIIPNSDLDVFVQGSYANKTNIISNSDIDINICYKRNYVYDVHEGFPVNNIKTVDISNIFLILKTLWNRCYKMLLGRMKS